MSATRWKFVSMPLVLVGLASPMMVNCGAGGISIGGDLGKVAGEVGDLASGCDELKSGDFAKLQLKGSAAVNSKVKGFLGAVYDFNKATVELETELIKSCGILGKDLGMAEDELKAEAKEGKGAEKVCGAVAGKVEAMVKANADAKITIEVTPPRCEADVEGMMKCFEECGSPVDPGKLEASCQGGEISGKCSAECKGSCTVDAGATCTGSCEGSCSGKCDANFQGQCGGKCDGKCDGKNSKGECKGLCEGKCDAKAEGQCGGTCEGSCSASCKLKAAAKCEGSCSGGCSVKIEAPKCSAEFKPPSVDASCQVSCGAKGVASAKCFPPGVKLKIGGKANVEALKLVAALNKSLPQVLKAQLGSGKRLALAGKAVLEAGASLNTAAKDAGGKGIACIASALDMTKGAGASIDLNVSVSAKVNASAGGTVK